MKLYSEDVDKLSILTESATDQQDNEPEYFLEGVFMQANIKNKNGRIYPMDVMKPEVERYIKECVDTNRAFGELLHPTTCTINLDRVSHMITKIWQDGDYFKARAKILDTPCGRIVKAMIKEGCQLGVSSRALGTTTRRNGIDYVNSDFHIVTAGDIVYEPSAQTAFPRGLMEDVEWEYDPETGEYRMVGIKDGQAEQPEQTDQAEQPADDHEKLSPPPEVTKQDDCGSDQDETHEQEVGADHDDSQDERLTKLIDQQLTKLQIEKFTELLKSLGNQRTK